MGAKGCTETPDMPATRAQAPRQQFAVPFVVGFCTACVTLWFLRPTARASDILGSSAGTQLAGGLRRWQSEDAKYLGPQKGDTPPARLDSYKYKTNEYQVWGHWHTVVSICDRTPLLHLLACLVCLRGHSSMHAQQLASLVQLASYLRLTGGV